MLSSPSPSHLLRADKIPAPAPIRERARGTRAERRRRAEARARRGAAWSRWAHALRSIRLRPQRGWFRRLRHRLAASQVFTCSLILHIALVLFVGSAALIRHVEEAPDFAPEGVSGLVQEDAPGEPPPSVSAVETPAYIPSPAKLESPAPDVIVSTATAPALFQMPLSAPPVHAAPPPISHEVRRVTVAALGQGGANVPLSMAGRFGGAARMELMRRNHMSLQSEKGVLNGLHWLTANQRPDGAWADRHRTAMTGLALLCYLGHGETPHGSREHGAAIAKAVDWLLQKGIKGNGALVGNGDSFGQTEVYEHAIGTYALAEYYTITHDVRVKDVLVQATRYIVDGQGQDGGWQYSYVRDGDSDTSVTGWQIQALKAAHLTGLNIPGVSESLDRSMADLARVQNDNGSFGYRNAGGGSYSLTGVGVLCTYFWKGDADESVRKGIKFIITRSQKDDPVIYQGPRADLYAWHHHTQACLLYGGDAWTKWNGWFQGQITNSESADGSWPPTGNPSPIGGLESADNLDGRCYRTCLCLLMLEVFYRYMPTTR